MLRNAAYLIFGHGGEGFDNGCQRHFALLCKVSSAGEGICCAPHEPWAGIPLKWQKQKNIYYIKQKHLYANIRSEVQRQFPCLPWSCTVKSVVTSGGTWPLMFVTYTWPPLLAWSSSITCVCNRQSSVPWNVHKIKYFYTIKWRFLLPCLEWSPGPASFEEGLPFVLDLQESLLGKRLIVALPSVVLPSAHHMGLTLGSLQIRTKKS